MAIYTTPIERDSEAGAKNSVVWPSRMIIDFSGPTESNPGFAKEVTIQINAASDSNSDGIPDRVTKFSDVRRVHVATPSQLDAANDRLRGSGNMMSAIGTLIKLLVGQQNGYVPAPWVQVDDDNPA